MKPKNTTPPPLVQHQLRKALCRYEEDLQCIISPIFLRVVVLGGGRVLFTSDPVFQKDLAVELCEMLIPHFPKCELRITETAGITREVDEFATLVGAHKNRIIQCREDSQPGLAYLYVTGYAPQNPDMPSRGAHGGLA